MDSRGRTKGERGGLSEKMFRDFFKEGSEKEGELTGLRGEMGVGPVLSRGGKSASKKRGEGRASTCLLESLILSRD